MSPVPMRIGVTRGDRFDVAEWEPGEAPWFGERPEPVHAPSSRGTTLFAVLAAALVIVTTFLFVRAQRPKELGRPLVATVGDLSAVHAKVTIQHGAAGGP